MPYAAGGCGHAGAARAGWRPNPLRAESPPAHRGERSAVLLLVAPRTDNEATQPTSHSQAGRRCCRAPRPLCVCCQVGTHMLAEP